MIWLLLAAVPLDRASRIAALRRGFRSQDGYTTQTLLEDPTRAVSYILLAVALIGMLAISVQVYRRLSERPSASNFFRRALRALALRPAVERDLWRVAQRAQLAHPLAMLLSPANLAAAHQQAQAARPDPALAERIGGISQQIFGRPLPPAN